MTTTLDQTVGWDAVPHSLAHDIQHSIKEAVQFGALIPGGTKPLRIFRAAVKSSLKRIEEQGGGAVLRFLNPGPYPDFRNNPEFKRVDFISDQDTATAVNYIFGGMMNTFKGALAELLAAGPVAALVAELKSTAKLPPDTQLFIGETVRVPQFRGRYAKAADFHTLRVEASTNLFELSGIGEVKSYRHNATAASSQIDRNLLRADSIITAH